MASSEITLEAVSSVSQIPAADWDACANPPRVPGSRNGLDTPASSDPATDSCADYNPFVSHAFFSAAEASGSACARTGWGPRHLLARVDGEIAGIVPCYLKSHSHPRPKPSARLGRGSGEERWVCSPGSAARSRASCATI